jgi:hypothetical protein
VASRQLAFDNKAGSAPGFGKKGQQTADGMAYRSGSGRFEASRHCVYRLALPPPPTLGGRARWWRCWRAVTGYDERSLEVSGTGRGDIFSTLCGLIIWVSLGKIPRRICSLILRFSSLAHSR